MPHASCPPYLMGGLCTNHGTAACAGLDRDGDARIDGLDFERAMRAYKRTEATSSRSRAATSRTPQPVRLLHVV